MKNKGIQFAPGQVEEWLDCGNKDATIYTNERILEHSGSIILDSSAIKNSEIIEPCFIGKDVAINNSKIGPHVSIGNNTSIHNSIISKTIIQKNNTLTTKLTVINSTYHLTCEIIMTRTL